MLLLDDSLLIPSFIRPHPNTSYQLDSARLLISDPTMLAGYLDETFIYSGVRHYPLWL